jgi:hypothetical protein
MRRFLIPPVMLLAAVMPIAFRRKPVNPPVAPSLTMEAALRPPPGVSKMLRRACYDCHSNETRWPWYSRVPGVGHMLERDVRNARAAFNFSEWAAGPYRNPRVGAVMLLGMCAAIREGQMPRKNYQWLHPEAKPSPSEIDEFCVWGRAEAKRAMEEARRGAAKRAQREIPRLQMLRIAHKAN